MTGDVVIQIVCVAGGLESNLDGRWVVEYDPDGGNGEPLLLTTSSVERARRFADSEEAWVYWKQTSRNHPVRPDGKPNRPLTMFTVRIGPADDGWLKP